MKVIWSATAVRQLQEVVEYIQGESADGTARVRHRILDTAKHIAQMPQSGRMGRVTGTREAVVSKSSYIVVYQIAVRRIEILAIWHGARRWPESF